jgi:predicted transcriptional regulator YheO
MKTVYDNWAFWQRLLNMLENEFGNRCELILHDLTKDYAHTVVDIRNGHITGRKIGDCGSNLGLEVLRGEVKDGDRYNYVVHTPDGKILRSSTMFLYDDDGKVIGSFCINLDTDGGPGRNSPSVQPIRSRYGNRKAGGRMQGNICRQYQ